LLERANSLLFDGDIVAARALFKYIADHGEPRAAFALAQTSEQPTLDRSGAKGITPEIQMAQSWYRKAK
jgi:TPR repeat protein